MRVAVKALGLATAVVGLTGYGVVRLMTWPVRVRAARSVAACCLTVQQAALRQREGRGRGRPSASVHVWSAESPRGGGGGGAASNGFVRLMVALALPAVGSLMERWSGRVLKSMERNAETAERYLRATMEAAAARGLVLGPVRDVSEDLTQEGLEQLRLDFPVLTDEGALVSRRGVCRVTLGRGGEAVRVHSFYEQLDGGVVDLLVELPGGGDGEGRSEPLIVDAEVVEPRSDKSGARSGRKRRKD